MVFMKDFFEKVDFEKNQLTIKKHKNLPGGRELKEAFSICDMYQNLEGWPKYPWDL